MIKLLSLIAVFVLIFAFLPLNNTNAATKQLEVHFIDVGQGDATLIKAPNGVKICLSIGDHHQTGSS